MVTESSTIYKLMILYMLNKLDSQLTNAQLSDFFISNDYTDYFTLQQTLSDLVESRFVEKITIRNTSYYSITPEGYESPERRAGGNEPVSGQQQIRAEERSRHTGRLL